MTGFHFPFRGKTRSLIPLANSLIYPILLLFTPNIKMPLLEIACFDPSSALTAFSSGASRIELCRSQEVGGLTPAVSVFQALKKSIPIPIYIMIRPHGHSFIYTPEELSVMEEDISRFGEAGASGFVLGALTSTSQVDSDTNKFLIQAAQGKPCTFHRAFDSIPPSEMTQQLEILIACGFKAVLTSGGAETAVEGKEVLRGLVERAGGRIEVIVGGGVRSGNVGQLRGETGAGWFHSSAVVDGGEEASGEEVRLLREIIDR
jgi:copper homeostasis protein